MEINEHALDPQSLRSALEAEVERHEESLRLAKQGTDKHEKIIADLKASIKKLKE